eukprot:TRINITY_DN26676_c0_g1_i1.p1 TRINITY_DN26676_c0_g1~~TRINITY_DN26676_c0_g1_i1.p1  ORF type:complete len:109 (-),score=18.45 TRINITY_DN26676_c0_g1_i1:10-336(-)
MAKISDKIGYGVFARKEFKKGDYIIRYNGNLTSAASISAKDRAYAMSSIVEGILRDASRQRNLAAIINHSSTTPNAQVNAVFDRGTEQEIGRAVQQECRDRSRMPSSA